MSALSSACRSGNRSDKKVREPGDARPSPRSPHDMAFTLDRSPRCSPQNVRELRVVIAHRPIEPPRPSSTRWPGWISTRTQPTCLLNVTRIRPSRGIPEGTRPYQEYRFYSKFLLRDYLCSLSEGKDVITSNTNFKLRPPFAQDIARVREVHSDTATTSAMFSMRTGWRSAAFSNILAGVSRFAFSKQATIWRSSAAMGRRFRLPAWSMERRSSDGQGLPFAPFQHDITVPDAGATGECSSTGEFGRLFVFNARRRARVRRRLVAMRCHPWAVLDVPVPKPNSAVVPVNYLRRVTMFGRLSPFSSLRPAMGAVTTHGNFCL